MSESPKPYRRPVSASLWFSKQSYTLFFFRELSAIPIAAAMLLQLYLVYQIGQGPEAFASAVAVFQHPVVVAFHVVTLAFVALHLYTWFILNARILEIRTGETAVNPMVLIVSSYLGLLAISAGVAYVLMA